MKHKKKVQFKDANKTLKIFKGEDQLTIAAANEVIDSITDAHISQIAASMPPELSGKCVLGWYVGQGTCLAKKFGKYGLSEDQKCKSCKHTEIIDQLNYVFNKFFEGAFHAEWVKKRSYKKDKIKNGG